jgi:hypothetical protein
VLVSKSIFFFSTPLFFHYSPLLFFTTFVVLGLTFLTMTSLFCSERLFASAFLHGQSLFVQTTFLGPLTLFFLEAATFLQSPLVCFFQSSTLLGQLELLSALSFKL